MSFSPQKSNKHIYEWCSLGIHSNYSSYQSPSQTFLFVLNFVKKAPNWKLVALLFVCERCLVSSVELHLLLLVDYSMDFQTVSSPPPSPSISKSSYLTSRLFPNQARWVCSSSSSTRCSDWYCYCYSPSTTSCVWTFRNWLSHKKTFAPARGLLPRKLLIDHHFRDLLLVNMRMGCCLHR